MLQVIEVGLEQPVLGGVIAPFDRQSLAHLDPVAGQRQSLEVARRIAAGESLSGMGSTCEIVRAEDLPENARLVPSFEAIQADPQLLIELFEADPDDFEGGTREWFAW